MRTKRVAGYKKLFFFNISIHGIRPVKIGNYKEAESFSADFHSLIIFYSNGSKIMIYNFFQKSNGAACSYDFHLRAVLQKSSNTSCMIRLCMIHDQIINFCYINNFFQLVKIFVKKFLFGCLKKDDLVSGFPYIGIIGSSKFRIHDNIKYPKIIIHNSCPVKTIA